MELRQLETDGRYVSLALVGSLDMNSITTVETRFYSLTVGGGKDTIVDLSELTFISSLGIGMLVSATKELKRTGAKLVVYAPTANVGMVFAKAGLKDYLVVAAGIDEARKVIGSPV
jgi:anti-sigma B factor antagonist